MDPVILDAMRKALGPAWRKLKGGWPKLSYSQCGEDLIMDFVLSALGRRRISYLDIGAHHAKYLSNSFRFYRAGGRGVLVEPDPDLAAALANARPRDKVLAVGLAAREGSLDFYRMAEPTLNTFSKAEAELQEKRGKRILSKSRVDVRTPSWVLETCFDGGGPDMISLDVEGMDEEIIKAVDLPRWKPLVICVETIRYRMHQGKLVPQHAHGIIRHLQRSGYMPYASTYINSIFVLKQPWLRHIGAL